MQLLLNAILATGLYALIGVGFLLIYRTAGFFCFAHAAFVSCGAYAVFAARTGLGVSLLPASLIAVFTVGLLGAGLYLVVFRSLAKRKASPLVQMVASLGIYVMVENALAMTFGDHVTSIRQGVPEFTLSLGGGRLTGVQGFSLIVETTAIVAVVAILRATRAGRNIRVLGCNPDLAECIGIPQVRTNMMVFGMAAGLGALAGILIALDYDATPTMGMEPFLLGVVSVVLGGGVSVAGTLVGAACLGVVLQLAAWVVGSQWQQGAAFLLLIGFMVFRPLGIVRRKG